MKSRKLRMLECCYDARGCYYLDEPDFVFSWKLYAVAPPARSSEVGCRLCGRTVAGDIVQGDVGRDRRAEVAGFARDPVPAPPSIAAEAQRAVREAGRRDRYRGAGRQAEIVLGVTCRCGNDLPSFGAFHLKVGVVSAVPLFGAGLLSTGMAGPVLSIVSVGRCSTCPECPGCSPPAPANCRPIRHASGSGSV